jgi:ADP-ribose pyrophosphatase YjhB (NUDIX family)
MTPPVGCCLVERGRPPGEGLWSVPGGKVELAETLAQAVTREVGEETGLVVEVGAPRVVERMGDDHHTRSDYVACVIAGELVAGSDVRAAKFVDEGALAKLPLTDGLLDVLVRARATHGSWFTSR